MILHDVYEADFLEQRNISSLAIGNNDIDHLYQDGFDTVSVFEGDLIDLITRTVHSMIHERQFFDRISNIILVTESVAGLFGNIIKKKKVELEARDRIAEKLANVVGLGECNLYFDSFSGCANLASSFSMARSLILSGTTLAVFADKLYSDKDRLLIDARSNEIYSVASDNCVVAVLSNESKWAKKGILHYISDVSLRSNLNITSRRNDEGINRLRLSIEYTKLYRKIVEDNILFDAKRADDFELVTGNYFSKYIKHLLTSLELSEKSTNMKTKSRLGHVPSADTLLNVWNVLQERNRNKFVVGMSIGPNCIGGIKVKTCAVEEK